MAIARSESRSRLQHAARFIDGSTEIEGGTLRWVSDETGVVARTIETVGAVERAAIVSAPMRIARTTIHAARRRAKLTNFAVEVALAKLLAVPSLNSARVAPGSCSCGVSPVSFS